MMRAARTWKFVRPFYIISLVIHFIAYNSEELRYFDYSTRNTMFREFRRIWSTVEPELMATCKMQSFLQSFVNSHLQVPHYGVI